MSEKVTLSDLRNAIEGINRDVMRDRTNGEVSNADILDRVKKLKAKEIEILSPQLISIALTKLYNEIINRKGPKLITDQGFDLFGDYRGIPKNITIVKGKKKDVSKLTFQEAELWVRSREKNLEETKNEEFKRLLEEARPFRESDSDTLEMAMRRKREAGKIL